jgi:hypothetical protein
MNTTSNKLLTATCVAVVCTAVCTVVFVTQCMVIDAGLLGAKANNFTSQRNAYARYQKACEAREFGGLDPDLINDFDDKLLVDHECSDEAKTRVFVDVFGHEKVRH